MFSLHMSTMLGWFDPIANWFNLILKAIFGLVMYALYGIYAAIALLCDVLQSVFRQLAGLGSSVTSRIDQDMSSTGDILTDFLNNSQIKIVFRNLMLVAVVLLLVFMVIAILKAEYSQDGKTTKMQIVGRAVKALFTFFLVPALTFGGIYISNALLKTLDRATTTSQTSSIAATVFMAASYNANRALVEYDADGNAHYVDEYFYNQIASDTANNFNQGYFGNNFSSVGLNKDASIAEQINYTVVHGVPSSVDFKYDTLVDDFLNYPETHLISRTITEKSFNYLNPAVIATYYRMSDVNWIILFGGIIITFYMMTITILGLIERIFKIAILYAISPPIVAMMPMDNGSAFGTWKKEMVQQVLSAYGAVVGMNFVYILMSISDTMHFSVTLFGIANYNSFLVTQVMRLLMIIVALSMAVKLPGFIAGFVGGKDAFTNGKSLSADVVKTATKGATIAAGIGSVAFRPTAKIFNAMGNKAIRDENGKKVRDADGHVLKERNGLGRFADKTKDTISGAAKNVSSKIKESPIGEVSGILLNETNLPKTFKDAKEKVQKSYGERSGATERTRNLSVDKFTADSIKAANASADQQKEIINSNADAEKAKVNDLKKQENRTAKALRKELEQKYEGKEKDDAYYEDMKAIEKEQRQGRKRRKDMLDAIEQDRAHQLDAVETGRTSQIDTIKTSHAHLAKSGYKESRFKDGDADFVNASAQYHKNNEELEKITKQLLEGMKASGSITADQDLTELTEAIKMGMLQAMGDSNKFLSAFNHAGKDSQNQDAFKEFAAKFTEVVNSSKEAADKEAKKSMSKDDKLISVIDKLSDKIDNINKK